MSKRLVNFLSVVMVLALISPALASPILLSGVPAYEWYHGCTPTAEGSIFGYYDLHGYPNMFATQGNAVYLTANVQDEISSPGHNAKYDQTPDSTSLSGPPSTSIADFLQTSVDPLGYGGTYWSKSLTGFVGYASYKGYTFTTGTVYYNATWATLVNEINAGRPMMFAVDSSGSGNVDHSIPVFGYDDRGASGDWFACYTTWSEDETPVWYKYQPIAVGNVFGVQCSMQAVAKSPEPITFLLLISGVPLICRRTRPN